MTTTSVTVLAGKPSEFRFKLSKTKVHHGKVAFKVVNKGLLPHTFKICSSPKGGHANACKGKSTKLISPGKSTTLVYVFTKKGTYEYICTVAGHAAAGMKGDLKVT
jgi:nitrite reductase (NO-forming)